MSTVFLLLLIVSVKTVVTLRVFSYLELKKILAELREMLLPIDKASMLRITYFV
jgi:hypothetical protein